jgi:hypothetical protein
MLSSQLQNVSSAGFPNPYLLGVCNWDVIYLSKAKLECVFFP